MCVLRCENEKMKLQQSNNRCASSISGLECKLSKKIRAEVQQCWERTNVQELEQKVNDISSAVDKALGDNLKETILGTLQAAITPLAEFVAEKITKLEGKLANIEDDGTT